MRELCQYYRCSYATLFLWMVAAFFVIDFARLLASSQLPLAEVDLLGNMSTISIAALFFSAVFVWVLRSDLTPEGIRSYDSLGRTVFIPWDAITAAARHNFLGLGYYRVESAEGTHLYVARYLSRQNEFETLVKAITPEENPFHACIAGAAGSRSE